MYRIAMLSVHTCPLAALGGEKTGGMNVYVRDLSRQLGRWGLHVDIFTRSQDPAGPRVCGRTGPNSRVIRVKAGPEAPYNTNLIFDHLPEFVAGVKRFVEQEDVAYDLIHSHYWLSGWAARQLQAEWSLPIVQMFHTLGHLKNMVAQREDEKESPRRIQVETQIMGFADRLVAATPVEKAHMTWLYGAAPSRIEVIPCGVDLSLFSPRPQAEAQNHLRSKLDVKLNVPAGGQRMVLFVGRIEPLKGIDTLVRAMALLAKDGRRENLGLVIVGGDASDDPATDNKEMNRLRRLRAELGLTESVTFLGARDQQTLPYYYSAADVVVMPSHYESFGMVALEAMACGTPVIASKVGGLTSIVQDRVTGFLVPHGDPTALAHKIELILQDHALRQKLGQQAAQRAQHYGWATVATQIVALYRQLVDQPHRRLGAQPLARVCYGCGTR